MGKGLGLSKESKGTHVAFAAGTGLLPFIDMVARLAMSMMYLVPGPECFDPDFKLILYVSFRNE